LVIPVPFNEPHFEAAFAGRNIPGHDRKTLRFTTRALGELVLPSGAIVACDPGIPDEYPAFGRRVAPGRYAVIVSVAQIADDQRVAYALLRFADAPPVQWENAAPPRSKVLSIKPGEEYGYGVDTGTGAFLDAVALQRLREKSEAGDESAWDAFVEQLGGNYVDTWSWGNATLDAATGANVIAFSSGYGDGFYRSYFGLDAAGNTVCLVTDFNVLDIWTSPKSANRPWWQFWEK
jgi:hypothetical protein